MSNNTTSPPDTSTSSPPTSLPPTETTTSAPPPPDTSTTTPPPPPTTQQTSAPPSVTTRITTIDGTTSTYVTIVTSTQEVTPSSSTTSTAATTGPSGNPINPSGGNSEGGLNTNGKIAVGVVVPIAAVALLILVGLFFWRRRKARKDAEEERRKEVEDYAYNPNADPTIPAVGVVGDSAYEMKEDGASGYRGWGSTTIGSNGRKASTTMSGGVPGVAYSDATSPTRGGAMSDGRSAGEPILENGSHGSHSPEGEILGAMGPSAAGNRGGDVRRGPSNASSSYSAAGRSDGSGDAGVGVGYGNGNQYYDQYGSSNPYGDQYSQPQRTELPGQPIIRDNPARRNTRIENPAHYPQQSAGISQNF